MVRADRLHVNVIKALLSSVTFNYNKPFLGNVTREQPCMVNE